MSTYLPTYTVGYMTLNTGGKRGVTDVKSPNENAHLSDKVTETELADRKSQSVNISRKFQAERTDSAEHRLKIRRL